MDNFTAQALEVARAIVAEVDAAGAAVVGSVARGDATETSDIDLTFVGEGPGYELSRRDGWLISTSWRTEPRIRLTFTDPAEALYGILGWRDAVILDDPQGTLDAIQQEAKAWTWDAIGDEKLEAWVADFVTGFAEEIHKITRMTQQRNHLLVAIQRSILALRLASPLAIHRRLLCTSENDLWPQVNATLGEPWATVQAQALGLSGETLEETAHASIRLFALACQEIDTTFHVKQREVVEAALAMAAEVIDPSP